MVDRSIGPRSQGAVHRKLHAVHRRGSQWEKDPRCDPMTEIQSYLDPTVAVHCQFIKGLFCAIRRSKSDPSRNLTAEDALDFE